MPRGIGILLFTHIFAEKHINNNNKANDINLSDEYIFGKKIAKKIKYINSLIGVKE
jgi:hypothetical protein